MSSILGEVYSNCAAIIDVNDENIKCKCDLFDSQYSFENTFEKRVGFKRTSKK